MLKRNLLVLGILMAIVLIAVVMPSANGANILGVFTSSSVSHIIIHMSVMKALAEKGHNVTVVTTTKPKVTHPNINHIYLPYAKHHEEAFNNMMKKIGSEKMNIFKMMKQLMTQTSMIDLQYDALKEPRFKRLYEDPDTKFDLLVWGYFMNDFQLGLGAKFKCPIVMIWTSAPMPMISDIIGNPTIVSAVPLNSAPSSENNVMNFMERTQNFVIRTMFRGMHFALEAYAKHLYNDLFGEDPEFPSLQEMKQNVSLLLTNSHFSEGIVQPLVPALVEIGGIQIKDKPEPLPKDIEEFLASAKDTGAILFSLGTNIQGSNVKSDVMLKIFKVLSGLKQKVIWKWEDLENTPGKSANILYKNWLPQDDILAHPNIKLFITHAGKGGIAEAQYHGVPMIALPMFADQHANAAKMEKAGYGLALDTIHITEEEFQNALHDVLTDPKYVENVRNFSNLYRDRPRTAKQEAVYWIEYVLRHHGAKHMQSPLVYLNYFQAESWDVIAFLLLACYLIFKIAQILIKFITRIIVSQFKSKKSRKVKKN